jgi:hypothetical protein
LNFIPLTQISLVTDHQVDEFASLIFFSAEKHLNSTHFFNFLIMSEVITRDQNKKSAQSILSQNDVIESVFSKRLISQSAQSIIMQAMQKMMQQILQSQQVIIERLKVLKVKSNNSFASSAVVSFALVSQSVFFSSVSLTTTENR